MSALASTTVHRVYKRYKTYYPKIIITGSRGITSKVIEEEYFDQAAAKAKAQEIIDKGEY